MINMLTISALTNFEKVKAGVTMTEDFDRERAHNMFYKMIQTDRLHRSVVESMHGAFKIHRSQHMMLMQLSKCENCASQKQIAERLSISPAAVAVSLKKLEKGGYIEKTCAKNDNRVNAITLTEKGKREVRRSQDFFDKTDYIMFSEFSEEDYAFFDKCLEKMMMGLKKYSENLDEILKQQAETN